MGFLDRFRKKPVYLKEAGKLLLSVATCSTETFLNEDLPEIAEDFGLDLDSFNIDILRSTILITSLWSATKALEGEKQQLIEAIHGAFFGVFDDEKSHQLKKYFSYICDKYNEAWDDSSGGNQSILSVSILSEIFYEGEHNENLLDIFAMSRVQTFVFSTMLNVLNARKKNKAYKLISYSIGKWSHRKKVGTF
jgi:hypothetical protein